MTILRVFGYMCVAMLLAALGAGTVGIIACSVFIFASVALLVGAHMRDCIESHSPEVQEKLETDWWLSDKELQAPKPEINWAEFGEAIEMRLELADDPWATIDTEEILRKAERDMQFVWPDNAEWECPNCHHRFNRPMDPCPFCEYEPKVDEMRPAQRKMVNEVEHRGWICGVCKKMVARTMHRCPHCGEGFKGGGPYRQEVFDGPDGPVIETIHVDPKTGDRSIVSSRELRPDSYEVVEVMQSGEKHIVPTTSSHKWSGGTDLIEHQTGVILNHFRVPSHHLGTQFESYHISNPRTLRLAAQIEEEVRSHRMTKEQARAAIQRLLERG